MAFESAGRRTFWLYLARSVTFDVAIAFLISWLFASPSEFWLFFSVLLAAILLLPIFLGLRSALYKIVVHLFSRRKKIDQLKREFRKAKLPYADAFFRDVDAYLLEVWDEESNATSARKYAGIALGQFSLLPAYSLIDALLAHATSEAALTEYFDEIRPLQSDS